jgi:anthranilate 1,2-dioxygenase small subunit
MDTYRLIAQTQAAYARTIDDDRLEDWPDYFTDPCRYVITTADNHREGLEGGIVCCFSQGMLRDRISALRDANIYERHHYRHILGAPFLIDAPPRMAAGSPQGSRHAPATEPGSPQRSRLVQVRSETPFLVARIMRTGETSVFATGRYLDTYCLVDGAAKLESRLVVCDSSRIDTLLAIPL